MGNPISSVNNTSSHHLDAKKNEMSKDASEEQRLSLLQVTDRGEADRLRTKKK